MQLKSHIKLYKQTVLLTNFTSLQNTPNFKTKQNNAKINY